MVRQTIQKGCGHLGIAKNRRPFAKSEIGCDDHRGLLVEPADQVKQQLSAGLREGQIAKLVEYDEIFPTKIFSQPALSYGASFGLESVDQIDHIEEPTACAVTNASASNRYGKMRFAGAGPTDQHKIALMRQKVAAGEIAHQRFVR